MVYHSYFSVMSTRFALMSLFCSYWGSRGVCCVLMFFLSFT